MGYDTVLFDLDHTLLDTQRSHEIAFDAAMRSLGVQLPTSVRADFDQINNTLWFQVEQGTMNPDELHPLRFQQLVEKLDLDSDPMVAATCFAQSQINSAVLYDGARELIERTTSEYRIVIVTNCIGAIQQGVLAALGLTDSFDAVMISSELGISKPDPAFFDATFAAPGLVDRSGAVVIGDSLTSDMQGGSTRASRRSG